MKQLLVFIFISLYTSAVGQFTFPGTLDTMTNNYRLASFSPTGHLLEDGFFQDELEEYTKTLSGTNLWFSGFAQDKGYLYSGDFYYNTNPNFQTEFISGPISNTTNQPLASAEDYFNRVWIIHEEEFESFKQNFQNGNLTIQNIPRDILEWPAKGNPNFLVGLENGNIINQNLAPFYDQNEDGKYNALDGDLPLYKSGLSFKSHAEAYAPYIFAFNVYNDTRFGNSNELKLEIHQSVFMLNCAAEKDLNHTIFTNFSIQYKGERTIEDFRLAFWEDAILNCNYEHTQIYIGCNEDLNSTYTYNGKLDSVNCISQLPNGTDLKYAITKNTLFLDKDIQSFLVFYEKKQDNLDPNTTSPQTAKDFHNLMSGKWLDGTTMTAGGIGYNNLSSDTSSILFPDSPTDPNGWSMFTEDVFLFGANSVSRLNVPTTLSPGQTINIAIANTKLIDREIDYPDIFNNSEDRLKHVKDTYTKLMNDPSYIDFCTQDICENNCVWPGDVLPDNIVDAKDILHLGAYKGKDWISGPARISQTTVWNPFNASNWDNNLLFTNGRHADCDGNGTIGALDFYTVSKNYNKKTPDYISNENNASFKDTENAYNIEINKSEINALSSVGERIFNFSVRPGLEGERFDIPYHGISFDIVYDSTLVSLAAAGCNVNQDFFEMNAYASYFHNGKFDSNNFPEITGDNRISFALTSEQGENQFPNQAIVNSCSMVVKSNITTSNADGRDTICFSIENSYLIDKDGFPLKDLGYFCNELIITGIPFLSSTDKLDAIIDVSVFPNPTSDELHVNCNSNHSGKFSLINLDGQKVLEQTTTDLSHNILLIDKIPAGVYFLSIHDHKNSIHAIEKIIILP